MTEAALKKKIKELERTVKTLEKDLIHDSLTGLKTRAFFEEEGRVYFEVAINSDKGERSGRRKWFGFRNISFVFFDIDHFKKINDTYGHAVGDEVLKAVAETLKTSIRDGDTAARWGGEELVVTLVGATARDAFNKAEDIRRQVEGIKFGKRKGLRVTISAGVATAESGTTFDEILKRADESLYKAKKNGRNKVVVYSAIS